MFLLNSLPEHQYSKHKHYRHAHHTPVSESARYSYCRTNPDRRCRREPRHMPACIAQDNSSTEKADAEND